jgi:HD-GYP domain-containing protein (c-di-GMP phosphodiesterase class II)
MRHYVPVPLERVQLGKPLPVDIWSPNGRLLLRREQTLLSEAHRDMLRSHQACMTETDAQAWQRALERLMRTLFHEGADMAQIAQLMLPSVIDDADYLPGHEVSGGWMDVQDVLRGLLYQGALAVSPLPRLQALEDRSLALLTQDPDAALLVLFQALPELNLGYCASHALLTGLVAVLTAEKLALPHKDRFILLRAALVMNIGMARLQDTLTHQKTGPSPAQRQDINTHAHLGVQILTTLGVHDSCLLDIVQWHHTPEQFEGDSHTQRLVRLLHLADTLTAKMAPRKVRQAMLPLAATKLLVQQSSPDTAQLRQAMVAALGFYPPGSYVQLANGEIAVVIARGTSAKTPHVASLIHASGMPVSAYGYRDTSKPDLAVKAPVAPHTVQVKVSADKVLRLRQLQGV